MHGLLYADLPLAADPWCNAKVNTLANVLIVAVALLHLWFLTLEIFLWTKPTGMAAFKTTPEFAKASSVLAANQGIYNGLYAVGLLAAVFLLEGTAAFSIKAYILGCITIAGIYGGITVSPRILVIQTIPAVVALVLLLVR